MVQSDAGPVKLSILLADGQWLFRAGARRLLEDLPYDATIREAKDGTETIEALKKERFGLIMLDHVMPDILPVPLLHSVQRYANGAPFIVLSAADDPEQAWIALEAGASGFLPKNSKPEVMLQAVLLALSGEVYLPAALARGRFRDRDQGGSQERSQRISLTRQQHIILQYLANGFSNKEIASAVDIAEGTVKSHIAALLRRLGAKNRTHAIIIAGQQGLLQPQGRSEARM